jgi:hypothetical protein
MHELLNDLAANVSHFAWLVSVPVAVVLVQVWFLRVALARGRACLALEDRAQAGDWEAVAESRLPGLLPVVLAVLAVLAIPAVAAWSVATSRADFLGALAADSPSEKAERISRGLGGMFNAVPWSINCFVPAALLAIVSSTMYLGVRRRQQCLVTAADTTAVSPDSRADVGAVLQACRGPGTDNLTLLPALLFFLGLFPVLSGAWAHCLATIKGLALPPHMPPEDRIAYIVEALDRSRALFAARAWLAWPGVILATGIGAVLLLVWHRRQAATKHSSPSRWTSLFASLACILAAAALFVAAAPYRAENNMPWPPPEAGDRLLIDDPQSPSLVGPDVVEPGPLLWLAEKDVTLDGRHVDLDGLEDLLRVSAHTYRLLHPGQGLSGILIVLADARTPIATLAAYLQAARGARYVHPVFLFTKRESLDRPILGRLSRVHSTGAKATLVGQADVEDTDKDEDAVLLRSSGFASYGDLANRLVELRRAGKDVNLGI